MGALLSRDGAVTDSASVLYDLAFVILALAWRFRASGDLIALQLTRETLRYINRHAMRNGGYREYAPGAGPRLQNPPIHLLEACLVAYEASGEEEFLAEAEDIITLFQQQL
jgi:mannose/cellobiose epimerase-like protein (N-acyl-D-glucosamine 2-epimerase family)